MLDLKPPCKRTARFEGNNDYVVRYARKREEIIYYFSLLWKNCCRVDKREKKKTKYSFCLTFKNKKSNTFFKGICYKSCWDAAYLGSSLQNFLMPRVCSKREKKWDLPVWFSASCSFPLDLAALIRHSKSRVRIWMSQPGFEVRRKC